MSYTEIDLQLSGINCFKDKWIHSELFLEIQYGQDAKDEVILRVLFDWESAVDNGVTLYRLFLPININLI